MVNTRGFAASAWEMISLLMTRVMGMQTTAVNFGMMMNSTPIRKESTGRETLQTFPGAGHGSSERRRSGKRCGTEKGAPFRHSERRAKNHLVHL